MGLSETIVFYLVVGCAVAAAVFVTNERVERGERLFKTATGVFFWPLYVPILLSARRDDPPPNVAARNRADPSDEITESLRQVEGELDEALASLDGWAEDVLARERDRIGELKAAWTAQALRIREMDRLLAQPEFSGSSHASAAEGTNLNERARQSAHARQQNIDRLRDVRRQAFDDLMGTLAWVRELVTMIHLAKFTGAPASRAEELVAQIAAAIEGISEVTEWNHEPALK